MPITFKRNEYWLMLRLRNDDDPIAQTGFYCSDEDCPCDGDERLVFIVEGEFAPAQIIEASSKHVLAQREKQENAQAEDDGR